jgi:hypothetical protein
LSLGIVVVPSNILADGEVTIFSEDFEGGLPGDWTVIVNKNCGWRDDDPGSRGALDGCSGIFMIADSAWCAPFDMDTELITPSIDCSAFATVVLEFDHYFKFVTTLGCWETGDVDVWDGAIWHNKAHYEEGVDVQGHVTIDMSDVAAGKSGVKIRWHYWGGKYDLWWQVDNVELSGVPVPPVGGEAYPVNKFGILVPWIVLAAAIMTGAILFTRQFRTQS